MTRPTGEDEMSEMTDERAAEVLAAHNEWRRFIGETGVPGAPEMGDPAEIGRAIDHAIASLSAPQPEGAEAVDFWVCPDCSHHYMADGIVCDCHGRSSQKRMRHVRMAPVTAQQPAADGGFTAADMMDARQEGRKEAQQPAAVDEALRAEVAAVWNAMPSGARYLDPPDGGDVPLHEQVRRMAADAVRAERLAEALRAVVADMREWGEPAKGAHVERIQRRLDDALRDHDQEGRND